MNRLVALIALLLSAFAAQAADKPNIIFIMADDLGYTDMGCYGSSYYETPNIDRLAKEGMKFTSGYTTSPNCQPTRAALMSGQYGPRTGVYTVGNIERFNWRSRPLRPVKNVPDLPLDNLTFAQSLKQVGYRTAMFGKWHLGNHGAHHPSQRGFDEAIESSGKHFDFETDPKTDYPKGTYLADFLTDKATDFIRRNKDEPFFLYLPHFGVHSPIQAKPELIAKFRKKQPAGGHHDPVYAAMIASVDESVGRILALLDELKISKNTLVVFTSDNGGVGGYVREGVKKGKDLTDNSPLRGGKGMLYEGGIRVPYIFRWPGKIAANTTCDEPINSVDFFPTVLDISGAKRPDNYILDGVNYTKLLKTKDGKGILKRDALYWHFPGALGAPDNLWRTLPVGVIRSGDWKLMEFFEDGRLELYNLRNDIGETKNLASAEPKKAKELHKKLLAWRKEIKAPMPQPHSESEEKINETPKNKKKNKAA
ncbi:MAG: sulfatase [Verrucomicrobia bacterium]|nr:sulfatase [Verrucomicrobiota bacterium]